MSTQTSLISGTAMTPLRKITALGKKRIPRVLFILAAIIMLSFYVYAFHYEPYMITIRHEEVFLDCWNQEHDGLKAVIISDIHQLKTPRHLKRLEQIIELANRENPDLIFLLGDFMGHHISDWNEHTQPEEITAPLARLKNRYGVFAVLGNHDWWFNGRLMRKALEKAGIRVLENEFVEVDVLGKTFSIAGLPDKKTRNYKLDLQKLRKVSEPAILLSHNPDYFRELQLPGELMLSGHTHGGQIALPIIGAIMVPSKYGKKHISGWSYLGDRKLFVTIGTGNSIINARFLCPPEIVVMTLRAASSKQER